MNERQLAILNKVIHTSKINVGELSKEFGVSQVTIRQDLKILEENGVLKRVHGGAVSVSDDDIMKRLSINYETKLRIAKLAATYVSNGETVLIESGSTNALLARELASKTDVTIITNSTFISRYVRNMNIKVILLGGDYQHDSEVVVGPLTKKCLKEFHVEKAFIGVDGFSPEIGFTSVNLMRADVAKAMAEQANKTIVVTDSSKFNKLGVTCMFGPSEVDLIFTDNNISEESLTAIKNMGCSVQTA